MDPPVATETVPIKTLPALTNFGFAGWANPITPGSSTIGFSPKGFPEKLTGGGTGRTALSGGMWLGIVGAHYNEKGYPYGAVFITDTGRVICFYKPDAVLDTADYKWQRME